MTTELVNGEPVEVQRLSDAARWHAINEFVWATKGTDCPDDEFADYAAGCRVLYRDNYDTGRSSYQVVDAQGRGDGTGEWRTVESSGR